MRISTRGRYGLRFMLELALHRGKDVLSIKDVATRHRVSEKYLWQVVTPLKSAGLVQAGRGARGGYSLSKPQSAITLWDIMLALEGDNMLLELRDKGGRHETDLDMVTRQIWVELGRAWSTTLSAYTLQDIAERCVERQQIASFMYGI